MRPARPARAAVLLSGALVLAGCAATGGHSHQHGASGEPTGDPSASVAGHGAGHAVSATPPAPAPLLAGERFVEVGVADGLPGGAYVPSAPNGGTDDYRCFLADPGITADSFVTGVQFLPGNPAVVHHAIVFRVEPDQVPSALARDAEDQQPGWQCFGGPGIAASSSDGQALSGLDAAPWLAGWAPGGRESRFADGVGVPLAAGSRVVVQMHYNLRAAQGEAAADSTHVRLRVSSRDDLAPMRTMLLPAPVELPCAPGQSGPLCERGSAVLDVTRRFGPAAQRQIGGLQLLCGGDPFAPRAAQTQSCTRPIRARTTVRAAAGHMHLLGRSITIVANAGTPRERTLLDIPVWDFDNQAARPLADPVALEPGDSVTVTCTHDATLRDRLPALQDVPDRYVVWGEGTTDEMCLGILLVT